ncbi:MAG: hypothetical protein LBU88_09315 [Treponema sp.]|jgi:hypothetical protein|nr:hypothetical protein [Treponema sp.]
MKIKSNLRNLAMFIAILIISAVFFTTCNEEPGKDDQPVGNFKLFLKADELNDWSELDYRLAVSYVKAAGTEHTIYSDIANPQLPLEIPRDAVSLSINFEVNMIFEAYYGRKYWVVEDSFNLVNEAYELNDPPPNMEVFPINFLNNINKITVDLLRLDPEETDKYIDFDLYINDSETPALLNPLFAPPMASPPGWNNYSGGDPKRYMHSASINNPQDVFKKIRHSSFERILPFRKSDTVPHMPYPGSGILSVPARHIQGLIYYDRHDMYIYSHCFDDDAGYLFFATETDGLVGQIKIINGHKHPGGMQILGDYLFIAIEQPNKRYVLVYDLMTFTGNKSNPQSANIAAPRYALYNISSGSNNPASAVGVTNLPGNLDYFGSGSGNATDNKWVIGVYDYSASSVYLYYTATTSGDLDSIVSDGRYNFTDYGPKVDMNIKHQYDSIALFTDTEGHIWMIGFRGEGSTQFDSYADLYKLTLEADNYRIVSQNPVDSTESKKIYTKGGLYHNSFRWGTSFQIKSSDSVLITVSERNLRKYSNSRIEHYY